MWGAECVPRRGQGNRNGNPRITRKTAGNSADEIFGGLTDSMRRWRITTRCTTSITTWKWLRAMLEHEAHHRGQLYLMLGLRGVTTPPIYGLTAEEVQAKSVRRTG